MKKSKKCIKFYFIILIIAIVILGLFLKIQLNTMQNEWIVYVNQTADDFPTKTTLNPKQPSIIHTCEVDQDCAWLSVNCCPETSGADWKCVNKQSDVICQDLHVICIQKLSPKPNRTCICLEGVCWG